MISQTPMWPKCHFVILLFKLGAAFLRKDDSVKKKVFKCRLTSAVFEQLRSFWKGWTCVSQNAKSLVSNWEKDIITKLKVCKKHVQYKKRNLAL